MLFPFKIEFQQINLCIISAINIFRVPVFQHQERNRSVPELYATIIGTRMKSLSLLHFFKLFPKLVHSFNEGSTYSLFLEYLQSHSTLVLLGHQTLIVFLQDTLWLYLMCLHSLQNKKKQQIFVDKWGLHTFKVT